MSRSSDPRFSPQLLIGLALLVLGVLLTLDTMNVLNTRDMVRAWWPLGMLLIGVLLVAQTRGSDVRRGRSNTSSRTTGWVFIVVGGWVMLKKLDLIDFNLWEMFWPLVLVSLGGGLVWQAVKRNQRRGVIAADQDASLNGILSGSKRRWDTSKFSHADLTAFWGGTELDLRKAALAPGEEAVIDVFALMGGHEVQVPEGWNVVDQIQPVLGGVEDKTDQPLQADAPRLVLKGVVIMGGLSVKH